MPAEHLLGLTEGGQAQAAASLAMMLLNSLTPSECVDVLKRVTGEAPAISTLAGLAAKAGQCLEECSEEVMPEFRKQEKLPENAAFFQTSFDGTMMRMNAGKNGDDVTEEAGWREASCGVLSIFDNGGNKLQRRYLGRLPEKGKQTLKEQLRQEVSHIRSQNLDLKLVAAADGAKDNWTFLKSLNPDLEVLDFWHAAEYLKRAADAVFGADEEASMKWFKAKRHIPRTDPEGVSKVINALRYLLRKGRGKEEIRKALGYFRNNRRRMNYYHVAEDGYPIGSGDVEAANKVLVNQRLKRSGQSWGQDGGQGVLSYRALLKSDRFDRAWSLVVPQLNRSKKTGIRAKPQQMTIGRSTLLRDSQMASNFAQARYANSAPHGKRTPASCVRGSRGGHLLARLWELRPSGNGPPHDVATPERPASSDDNQGDQSLPGDGPASPGYSWNASHALRYHYLAKSAPTKSRRDRLRRQRRCERPGSRVFSQPHRANGATVTEARLHQPTSSSSLVVPGRALRHRPTRWIGSSPLPQPMCYPRQARCVNNSVRVSLDAWGASLLLDVRGAPFR